MSNDLHPGCIGFIVSYDALQKANLHDLRNDEKNSALYYRTMIDAGTLVIIVSSPTMLPTFGRTGPAKSSYVLIVASNGLCGWVWTKKIVAI